MKGSWISRAGNFIWEGRLNFPLVTHNTTKLGKSNWLYLHTPSHNNSNHNFRLIASQTECQTEIKLKLPPKREQLMLNLIHRDTIAIQSLAEDIWQAAWTLSWKTRVTSLIRHDCFSKWFSAEIDWLEFNGTFSTVRLYRAFRSYSLCFGK